MNFFIKRTIMRFCRLFPLYIFFFCLAISSICFASDYSISINSPASITEGDSGTRTITYNVTITPEVDNAASVVYVDWTTVDGTASSVSDFVSASGSLTFDNTTGDTQTLSITINGDTLVENDEIFTVNLTNASISTTNGSTVSIGTASATGTIQNDDTFKATIEPGPKSADEGDSVSFTVSLDHAVAWDVDVSYTVSGSGVDPAEAGDYSPASGSVTIPAGSLSNTITVDFAEDSVVESDEGLSVLLTGLSPSTSGNLGAVRSASGSIVNDDIPSLSIGDVTMIEGTGGTTSASFSVVTDTAIASDATVSVDFEVQHDTTEDDDFSGAVSGTLDLSNLAAGGTGIITIHINADNVVEPDESYILKLSNVVVQNSSSSALISDDQGVGAIRNDDIPTLSIADLSVQEGNSGTTSMSFAVSSDLEIADNASVTFDYSVSNGGAEPDDFFGSTSGSQSISDGTSTNVVVVVSGDTVVEEDETFKVEISNPAMSGTGTPTISDDTADGTIENDDSFTVNVSVNDATVFEDEGPVVFNVILDNPVAWQVDVNYSFNASGTDTAVEGAGNDYLNPGSSPLQFGAGETFKTVTVNLINDDTHEADEEFTLTIFPPSPSTSGSVGTASASVKILNDDHLIAITADQYGKITTGGGTTVNDGSTTVLAAHDSTPIFEFSVTDSCYHLSDYTVDGVSQGELGSYADPNDYVTDSYTFDPVTEDHTVSLFTEVKDYTVTSTVLGGHGTVTPTAQYPCDHGSGPVYGADAEEGYHITWFKVDGVEQPGAQGQESYTYIFPAIEGNHTIEVAFTQRIYIHENSPFGTVTPDGDNGLDEDKWVEVDYGDDQTFSIAANAACSFSAHNGKQHHISMIKWDDTAVEGIQGAGLTIYEYTASNVTENHSLEIYFASYLDITIGEHGEVTGHIDGFSDKSIDGPGTDSWDIEVELPLIMNNVPDEGYHISSFTVDGVDVGLRETYTFSNVVDEDHTYEVVFAIDTFVIEPVSKFGVIYDTSSQATQAIERSVNWHADSSFYVDMDDPDHAVVGILVDNVSYDIPSSGTSITYDDFVLTNVSDDYIEVKFTQVEASHRLEAMDYDKTPISDVPLDAKLRPKPASIMFVLDDSGSMDWEFITSEGDGKYSGRYYVYSYPSAARAYGDYSLQDDGGDDEWPSQCSEYNKMFYNPTVEYKPWPTFTGSNPSSQLPAPSGSQAGSADGQAHANIFRPRFHPWNNQDCTNAINKALGQTPDNLSACDTDETFDMDGTFLEFENDSNAIIVDNVDAAFSKNGDWSIYSASGDYGANYYYTLAGATVDIANWSFVPLSTQEYEVFVWWRDNSSRRTDVPYTVNCNNCGPTGVTVAVNQRERGRHWHSIGKFDFEAGETVVVTLTDDSGQRSSSCADAVKIVPANDRINIINAHYYTWNDADGDGSLDYTDSDGDGQFDKNETVSEDIWLVNLVDPVEYYRVIDPTQDITSSNLQRVSAASVPSTVKTYVSPTDADAWRKERQNWADWFSYYRKRTYSATAAVAHVISKMDDVEVGFRTINYSGGGYENGGYGFSQPLLPVNVAGEEDKTNRLLEILYAFPIGAHGTPLRNGLKYVGQYYDDTDGINPSGLGESPFHAREDGDECKQVFTIAMTDGYWNGGSPSVGNADGDNGAPYADNYSNTLADVAMKYFETDLSTLDDMVPDGINSHQHMVTYTVAFGVHGTIDPSDYDLNNGIYPTWSSPTSSNPAHIDDLWHAAVNGHGKFMSASRPDQLVASLLDIMNDIGSRIGSGASVSVNGDELYESVNGQVRMFQTTYNSGDWHGDLQAYQINTTTGEVRTESPVWSAEEKMAERIGADGAGHTDRIIVYFNHEYDDINGTVTGYGLPFQPGNLSGVQSRNLIPYFADSRTRMDVVNYLRGDKTNEGDFRIRDSSHPLGDFIHSLARYQDGVLYVGGNDGLLHAFYAGDDEDTNQNGVLDPGEDVNGNGQLDNYAGKELFAYIPGMVFNNLRELADPLYDHKFFVDNTPYAKTMGSHTYLVGGLGKGGKGYYCLDITNVLDSDGIPAIDNETEMASRVKWEYPPPPEKLVSGNTFTFSSGTGSGGNDRIIDSDKQFSTAKFVVGKYIAVVGANYNDGTNNGTNDGIYEIKAVAADGSYIELPKNSLIDGYGDSKNIIITESINDQDMGYSYSRPVIVQSNDSTINNGTDFEGYVVIFGNGYASENGEAVLYVLDPVDGGVIKKIRTGASPFNGMSTPKLVDVNFDLKVDYVYAGDLLGNMWKFDLTSSDNDDWQVAFCDNADAVDHCKETVSSMIPRPLFSGVSAGGTVRQAITAAPDIMYHSSGQGYMVIFGTGRYLGIEDLSTKYTQSLYGIWDWAPDNFDAGYHGTRVDDEDHTDSEGEPLITLSNWPETEADGDAVHTLLRQVVWLEGEISEDTNDNGTLDYVEDANHNGVLDDGEDLNGNGVLDNNEDINGNGVLDDGEDINGNGHLDVDEDVNDNGSIDVYSYYRIPSNYQGDWSLKATSDLDEDHSLYNYDINGDGDVNADDRIPAANVGWCFDLPGIIDLDGDGIDNDGDGSIDEEGERILGERVVNDTIIRDGKAIILSFGVSGTRCNAGGYSFVNEREPDTGGMLPKPAFDINGDGIVDEKDMVYISVPGGGFMPGIPTDRSYEGRLFNPSILRKNPVNGSLPVEMKYFSTSSGGIGTMTESAERRGIYYWRQVE